MPELTRLLAEGKEVRFTPSGQSMRPFIEGDRDSVILVPMNREPKRGDIVLAQAKTADNQMIYVLHRISKIISDKKPVYVLQGDGNLRGEEYTSREQIIGRVTRIEGPNGKRKILSRGLIWQALRPIRPILLKIYRHL